MKKQYLFPGCLFSGMSRIIRFCLVGVSNLSPVNPWYVPVAVAGRLMNMVKKQYVKKLSSPKRASVMA